MEGFNSKNTERLDKCLGIIIIIILVSIFICLWEILVKVKQIPVYLLPSPSIVIRTLFSNIKMYSKATLVTSIEAATGLGIGVITGIALASLLDLAPRLERSVLAVAIFIKSTPLVAIAPLLTIWLGFGMVPKIIMTALLSFFPTLINVLSGFKSVKEPLLDTFRSWDASRFEIFFHLRLPFAVPYLFAALKVSAPLSFTGAVIAEWTGSSAGLGRVLWLSYSNLNLPFLFATVIILAIIGISIYSFLILIEKRVVFWNNY